MIPTNRFSPAGKLADVLIIATQDSQHFDQAIRALELGYDLLLEKPAAESLDRCEEIDRRARKFDRRVALCFVLRYTPFYSTVKQLIESGRLGRIISIRTHEGVAPLVNAPTAFSWDHPPSLQAWTALPGTASLSLPNRPASHAG